MLRGKLKAEYILVVKALAKIGLYDDFTVEQAQEAVDEYIDRNISLSGEKAVPATKMERQKLRTILNRLSQKERGPMFAKSKRTGRYHYQNPLTPIFITLDEYI